MELEVPEQLRRDLETAARADADRARARTSTLFVGEKVAFGRSARENAPFGRAPEMAYRR